MMSRRTSYNREAKKGKMMEEGNCAFELKRRWLEIVWRLQRKRWNRETPQTGQQRSRQTRNPESAERSETEKQKQRKQQQGKLTGSLQELTSLLRVPRHWKYAACRWTAWSSILSLCCSGLVCGGEAQRYSMRFRPCLKATMQTGT